MDNISFSYNSSDKPVLDRVSLTMPRGWSGVIGQNGCGKSTLLHVIAGTLTPSSGVCRIPESVWLCSQRTDNAPAQMSPFLEDTSRDAWRLKTALEIDDTFLARWSTLSHGERKRCQVGVALWASPDVLLLDEPTNHLDSRTRTLLAGALRKFSGIGVLVSHDRELLNQLCQRCISFEEDGIIVRPGTFDQARSARAQERAAAVHRATEAQRSADRLARELQRRKVEAALANQKRSKRHISAKDHDAKERIDRALVSGKDAKLNNAISRMATRVEAAQAKALQLQAKKELSLRVTFQSSREGSSTLISAAPGAIQLSEQRVLAYPSLRVTATSRISICGNNGVGKSSLLSHLISISGISKRGALYLPQETTEYETIVLQKRLRAYDRSFLGRILGIVGRLGSDPKLVLSSHCPSPGETRKILIAEALSQCAPLLMLDEPTNHLDLDAACCLGEALKSYTGALIIISHDDHLMDELTNERWMVTPAGYVELNLP